tara:strand:+ start:14849 stop:15532 length:684 start_codon:yes stop_codon:yes gene_type:complete
MKRFYKIISLFFILIFLTTYTPNTINFTETEKDFFFKIKNIEITNNYKIKKKDILSKLNHLYKKNIILIKDYDFQKPLESVNFLERIEVKKKYPSTIILTIHETKPLAIIFKNEKKYVIDSSSNLISYDEDIFEKNLPNILGKGAEKDFLTFFDQLNNNNFPSNKIENYYYFQINRWDIKLRDDKLIKFPADKRKEAIQQSVELLNRKDFKNYKVIDLRIQGKIVVE